MSCLLRSASTWPYIIHWPIFRLLMESWCELVNQSSLRQRPVFYFGASLSLVLKRPAVTLGGGLFSSPLPQLILASSRLQHDWSITWTPVCSESINKHGYWTLRQTPSVFTLSKCSGLVLGLWQQAYLHIMYNFIWSCECRFKRSKGRFFGG